MKYLTPDISVVMPVYNSAHYIAESIHSVLNQSYKNYEFIIINDGSTDESINIIQSFKDPRIILINNEHNYIASLNIGLKQAKGKYIARFDSDDIMHPDRLKIQHFIFENFKSIDFCGTWSTFFNENTGKQGLYSTIKGEITNPLVCLLKNNCFTHPSMMFRKSFLTKNNLQYRQYDYAEDYKLWIDAAMKGAKFYIEPQSLLYYRIHSKQISQTENMAQERTSNRIKEELLQYLKTRLPRELTSFLQDLQLLELQGMINSHLKYNIAYSILLYNNIQL